ncbi:Transcription and mRNA export factor eny2 [Perkinsus olseni]|uniref:Transcription and mRNA export factor ENY2 n=1 Tax=Perkinsus olseni TaxID=32597 RepID=A0A7J6RUT9_PEROL|nr:Transcription and mRNA export factor eny2 [Perkinsus olseni]
MTANHRDSDRDLEVVRHKLNQALIESGERDRLKQVNLRYVMDQLMRSGWRDELKEYCVDFIKSRGVEAVSVDDIVSHVAPRGRQLVPGHVKNEVLERIKEFAGKQEKTEV